MLADYGQQFWINKRLTADNDKEICAKLFSFAKYPVKHLRWHIIFAFIAGSITAFTAKVTSHCWRYYHYVGRVYAILALAAFVYFGVAEKHAYHQAR